MAVFFVSLLQTIHTQVHNEQCFPNDTSHEGIYSVSTALKTRDRYGFKAIEPLSSLGSSLPLANDLAIDFATG